MRIFAGPNGSGKSTIIAAIQQKVRTGVYINADEIEKKCKLQKFLNLAEYGVQSSTEHFDQFLQQSSLLEKAQQEGFKIDIKLTDNILVAGNETNSYEASLIAAYLRALLLENKVTFSFETVMSHPSKLETLKNAREAGFKSYLYFIATEDPSINQARVEARVKKGGHSVHPQKIVERYHRSLELLHEMVPYCHRCFVFDNSGTEFRLIAEIENGETIKIHTDEAIPQWINKYLLTPLGL